MKILITASQELAFFLDSVGLTIDKPLEENILFDYLESMVVENKSQIELDGYNIRYDTIKSKQSGVAREGLIYINESLLHNVELTATNKPKAKIELSKLKDKILTFLKQKHLS